MLLWVQLVPRLASIFILATLVFLFWWFLTAQVSSGRDWARILYLVLTVLDVLGVIGVALVPTLAGVLTSITGAASLLTLVKIVLQATGIVILFTAPQR